MHKLKERGEVGVWGHWVAIFEKFTCISATKNSANAEKNVISYPQVPIYNSITLLKY